MKRLIINADDFGPNSDVNHAIVNGMRAGWITSVSVMANFASSSDLDLLATCAKSAGVHLNYFSGRPLSPTADVSSLVDSDGNFKRISSLTDLEQMVDPHHLELEFIRQVEKMSAGPLIVSHLDNHRPEIYLIPGHLRVALIVAKKFNLPVRNPFSGDFKHYAQQITTSFGVKPTDMEVRIENALAIYKSACLKSPDYFISRFVFNEMGEDSLLDALANLGDGTSELCVHPSNGGGRGAIERDVLSRNISALVLEKNEIVLVPYETEL
jgi:predicted glycoside hydrolase/deacetylase ChbG (UPF0249 family)